MPVKPSYVKFAKGTSSARFLKSCKVGTRGNSCKKKARKNISRQSHHVLTKISLKCRPSKTFCCKPRLLKCPWSRAMSNLPRGPQARVFWNSAKLGPGKTTAKRRPEKTPWRQCHHVLTEISSMCQPSKTFCCKPRLPKCPWSRAMSNLPRGPPARVFWNSAKLGPGETPAKRRPEKNTLAPMPSCPNYHFLEVPTWQNILLQTAHLKLPVKPSYVKFAKGTPSARFLKFCKVGTRENYCKKKARKTP